MSLAGRVDDLVNGLHGEVESHEFASVQVKVSVLAVNRCSMDVHWSETGQCSTRRNTRETHFGDRRVDNTLLTELV